MATHAHPNNNCLIWTGCTNEHGYGVVNVGGRSGGTRKLHRWKYQQYHKLTDEQMASIPAIRHTCHIPACYAEYHLQPGTHAENMADMVEAGRSRRGSSHYMAKLTEEDVRSIRKRYAAGGITMRQLATEHGIVTSSVEHMIAGRTWKNV